jgi:hypothetical protein
VRPGSALKTPNLGKVSKGPVAFDGYVHRSLVEVIPNFLSHIHAELAAIRAKIAPGAKLDRMVYDYNSGHMMSAKVAKAEALHGAETASMRHFDALRRRVGGSATEQDDVGGLLSTLRDSDFHVVRHAGAAQLGHQLEQHAAQLSRMGNHAGAAKIRKGKDAIVRKSAQDPRYSSRIAFELQSSILRARSEQARQMETMAAPGNFGGARWSFASELQDGSGGALGEDILDAHTKWQSKQKSSTFRMGGNGQRYIAPMGGRLFHDLETGKVTLRAVLRAPGLALSKALDGFERGVSDFLFGRAESRLGGMLGKLRIGLVGGRGPDGRRTGGMFGDAIQGGADFFHQLGQSIKRTIITPMKETLFGKKGGQGGALGALRDLFNKAVAPIRAKMKEAGEWIKTKVFDPFSKWLNDPKTGLVVRVSGGLTSWMNRMNERMFGSGGIMGRIEGSINRFFHGDPSKDQQGFVKRFVEPTRDYIRKEIWDPLKANLRSMWDEAGKFLRKEVVDPLKGVMTPFIREAKEQWRILKEWTKGPLLGALRNVGKEIDGVIKGTFGRGLGDMLRDNVLNPIKEALSSVRKFLGDALSTLLRIPVNILRGASDELKVSQLKRGVGQYISADERARLIRERGLDPATIPHSGGSSILRSTSTALAIRERGLDPATIPHSGGSSIPRSTSPALESRATEAVYAAAGGLSAHIPGGASKQPGGQRHGIRGVIHPTNMSMADMTAIIRDATRATADNTRNIYTFITRHLWGVGKNVERIVQHFKIHDTDLGKNDAAKRSGILGRMRNFLSNPLGGLRDLVNGIFESVNGILKRVADKAVDLMLLPFRAAGKIISGINDGLRWIRREMGDIFGLAKDGVKTVAKGIFWTLRESMKAAGTAFGMLGTALLGGRDASGKRTGGLLGQLAASGFELGMGVMKVAGGLAVLSLQLLEFGGQLIGIAAHVAKEAIVGLSHVVFDAVGSVTKGLFGGRSLRSRVAKLTPVYVVGGYLAGTEGGARSLAEAEAGMGGSLGRAASRVAGLVGFGAAADRHFAGAKASLLGGFKAVGEHASRASMAKTMSEWRARSLAAAEGSAKHLSEIRRGFHSMADLLAVAIPAIATAIGGVYEFFVHGHFIKSLMGLMGARGGAGALVGGAAESGARAGGFFSRTSGRLGGALGRAGGGRVGRMASGIAEMFGRGAASSAGKVGLSIARKAVGLGKWALGGVSGLAGLAGMGLDAAGDMMGAGAARTTTKTAGSMLSYGATGAMLGSFLPVVGTAAGAGIGAGIGAVVENWNAISGALSSVSHSLFGTAAGMAAIPRAASLSVFGSGAKIVNGIVVSKGTDSILGRMWGSIFGSSTEKTPDGQIVREGKLSIIGTVRHETAQTLRFFSKALYGEYDASGRRIEGSSYVEKAESIVHSATKWVKDSVHTFGDFLFGGDGRKDLVSRAWDSVTSTVSNWGKALKTMASKAWEATKTAPAKVLGALKSAGHAVVSAPGKVLGAAVAGAKAVGSAIASAPGKAYDAVFGGPGAKGGNWMEKAANTIDVAPAVVSSGASSGGGGSSPASVAPPPPSNYTNDRVAAMRGRSGGGPGLGDGGGADVGGPSLPGPSGLGSLSSRFESSGNPGARGWDKTGGFSYGTYQIATRTGTFNKFMSYLSSQNPAAAKALTDAGGTQAAMSGNPAFQQVFKQLASDPSFAASQHDFIKTTHFDPLARKMAAQGLDVTKRSKSLQDVVWSTAVQHGGNTDVIVKAMRSIGKPPDQITDAELTTAIYRERATRFGSSSAKVQASVRNRFVDEQRLALGGISSEAAEAAKKKTVQVAAGPASVAQAPPGAAPSAGAPSPVQVASASPAAGPASVAQAPPGAAPASGGGSPPGFQRASYSPGSGTGAVAQMAVDRSVDSMPASQAAPRISREQPDSGGGIVGLLTQMLSELKTISANTGKATGAAGAGSAPARGGDTMLNATQNTFALHGNPGRGAGPGPSPAMAAMVQNS